MPDFPALRERALSLQARKAEVAAALTLLDGIGLVVTPAMRLHTQPDDWDEDAEGEDEETRGVEGGRYPLFSLPALMSVSGGATIRTFARNALHAYETMGDLCVPRGKVEAGDEAPDLSGLTGFELGAVVSAYVRVIEADARDLLEIGHRLARLRREQSPLPGYVRGACLGMFGRPDRETAFTYEEGDFADWNRREDPVLPGEPGYREGRNLTRQVNLHPHVFSARYLAPFVGERDALAVDAALARVSAAARLGDDYVPGRPGDRGFPDRVTVSYAPGEVDLEPLPAPAP